MDMNKINKSKQVVVYQTKNGELKLQGDFKKSTVWASQAQIANIFLVERSVVTKHIRNILSDKELDSESVCANFAHTGSDGKTYQVQYYSLDVILATGYRVSSARAIEFRKWATKILRNYITDGYVINKQDIIRNYQNFLEAVEDVKRLLPENKNIDTKNILELIKIFANTWFSLDVYDKDKLESTGYTKKKVSLAADKLLNGLAILKAELISKNEASDLFARESKAGNLSGIIGNVMQSFDGQDLYATIEEKAVNLFYLIIKSHPFVDGNKRSGAYAFIWFLNKVKVLNINKINPPALTALTILIAESNPKEKEKMIKLVLTILGQSKS